MIFTIILIISISLYIIEYVILYYGSYLSRIIPRVTNKISNPKVSIIVASRNEELNIESCIKSLILQTYPNNKIEIILVNDESEDLTLQIMEKYEKQYENIHIISTYLEDSDVRGKARALAQGIDSATGEIILLTDADCTAHKEWVSSIISYFNDGVDIVGGFTVIKGSNIFSCVQQLDWIHLQTMSSSGMALGYPLGIIGNNFSFKKECYDAVGGYRGIPFTVTEDFALFEEMRKKNYNGIYPCLTEASITTLPCNSLMSVMRQKQRWSRGGSKMDSHGYIVLFIAFMMMISFTISPFLSVSDWVMVWSVKFICDLAVMIPTLGRLKLLHQLRYFLLFEFYFLFQTLVVPFLLTQKGVIWKGRVYES